MRAANSGKSDGRSRDATGIGRGRYEPAGYRDAGHDCGPSRSRPDNGGNETRNETRHIKSTGQDAEPDMTAPRPPERRRDRTMRDKIPQQFLREPAVDVSDRTALAPEQAARQWLDPRSRMAEVTASLEYPVHVSGEDPNVGKHLGGHRVYLFADNALYERVGHLRRHRLHRPNLKALHLNACVTNTQAAATAKRRFAGAIKTNDNGLAETESMNFMEHTVVAMYSGVAALEVFANETIGDKLQLERDGAEELTRSPIEKKLAEILPDLLRVSAPKRTRWWPEFQAIRSARNSLTHGTPKTKEDEEKIAQA